MSTEPVSRAQLDYQAEANFRRAMRETQHFSADAAAEYDRRLFQYAYDLQQASNRVSVIRGGDVVSRRDVEVADGHLRVPLGRGRLRRLGLAAGGLMGGGGLTLVLNALVSTDPAATSHAIVGAMFGLTAAGVGLTAWASKED